MRLMISDMKFLVLLAYPLALGGGMLQADNLWEGARIAATLPAPTNMQLFLLGMLYPLFLTVFFRVDGEKAAFKVATVVFISAMLGLAVYPLLSMLFGTLMGSFDASAPWFNLLVVGLDMVAAFLFLLTLRETDLHKLPPQLIFGSLFALEFAAVCFLAYNFGLAHMAYAMLLGKQAALPR